MSNIVASCTALHPLEGRKEPPPVQGLFGRPALHVAGPEPGAHLDGRLGLAHAAAVVAAEALIDTLPVIRTPGSRELAFTAHCWGRRGSLRLGLYFINKMAARTQRCVLPVMPMASSSSWRRNTSSSGTLTRMAQSLQDAGAFGLRLWRWMCRSFTITAGGPTMNIRPLE